MCNKILLVEDEKDLARAESKILEFNKYQVKVAYNGQEALDMQKEDNFDVVILDIMMPVMDGMTCLREMRKTGINTPVILLTAKAQIDDKVEGLDAGANDYLVKPFNMKELLARIRVLTRANEDKNNIFAIGNIIFDKEKSELSNNKQMVFKLSDKESGIMEMLIKNQDRIFDTFINCFIVEQKRYLYDWKTKMEIYWNFNVSCHHCYFTFIWNYFSMR